MSNESISPQSALPAGGLLFLAEEQSYWRMLFRALLISLVLHLAATLSLDDVPNLSNALPLRNEQPLSLALRQVEASEAQLSNAPTRIFASGASQNTTHSSIPQFQKAGKSSEFRRFSRLTVGVGKPESLPAVTSPSDADPELPPLSSETISEYRLSLARTARRFKVYPQLAREAGWVGVSTIIVAMSGGLTTPVVSLERSSGHEVLDREALEMVRQAVNYAGLPDGLRGRRMSVVIPVEYSLAD